MYLTKVNVRVKVVNLLLHSNDLPVPLVLGYKPSQVRNAKMLASGVTQGSEDRKPARSLYQD